jgi:hypothetical protein
MTNYPGFLPAPLMLSKKLLMITRCYSRGIGIATFDRVQNRQMRVSYGYIVDICSQQPHQGMSFNTQRSPGFEQDFIARPLDYQAMKSGTLMD